MGHPMIIFYYAFTLPNATQLSFYNYLITYFGICGASYMLATCVFLGVEKPIANILRVLEQRAKSGANRKQIHKNKSSEDAATEPEKVLVLSIPPKDDESKWESSLSATRANEINI